MSYTPRHGAPDNGAERRAANKAERYADNGAERHAGGSRRSAPAKQKKGIAVFIIVFAVIAVAVVAAILLIPKVVQTQKAGGAADNPDSGEYYRGSFTSPNPVLQYSDGEIPTTGVRHDVTVDKTGGPQAMEVIGNWRYDEASLYNFDGYGRGVMITPKQTYTFAYSAADGVILIDFDVDDAMDNEYRYTISGDQLTLTHDTSTYVFTKEP